MRNTFFSLAAAAALVAAPGLAEGQSYVGLPANPGTNVSAVYTHFDGGAGYGMEVRGLSPTVGAWTLGYDYIDPDLGDGFHRIHAGASYSLERAMEGLALTFHPAVTWMDFGGETLYESDLALGLALGTLVQLADGLDVAPFVNPKGSYVRYDMSGTSESDSEFQFSSDFGLGFHYDRFTVRALGTYFDGDRDMMFRVGLGIRF